MTDRNLLVTLPVEMTRDEAERAMRAINKAREAFTAQAKSIERKRSWRSAEKACALADREEWCADLIALQKLIGSEFNLGGY